MIWHKVRLQHLKTTYLSQWINIASIMCVTNNDRLVHVVQISGQSFLGPCLLFLKRKIYTLGILWISRGQDFRYLSLNWTGWDVAWIGRSKSYLIHSASDLFTPLSSKVSNLTTKLEFSDLDGSWGLTILHHKQCTHAKIFTRDTELEVFEAIFLHLLWHDSHYLTPCIKI